MQGLETEVTETSSDKQLREIMTARIIFGVALFVTGIVFRLLSPGSVSLRNLTYIALGGAAAVTR